MDRAARLLGVSIHVAWRRIESHGIEVHAVEWDGRRVQAVLRSAVLALRRESEQDPQPTEEQAARPRSLRVRPVRAEEPPARRAATTGDRHPSEPLLDEVQDILRERDLLRIRVENMASELDGLKDRAEPVHLEQELAAQAGENAVLRERLRSLEITREELASQLDEALRRTSTLTDGLDRAKADAAHFETLNARVQSAETRLEAAKQELELTQNELAVERERARLNDDLRAELRALSADREQLVRDVRTARTESKELAKTVRRLEADARSSACYLDKLERKLRAAKERARRSRE